MTPKFRPTYWQLESSSMQYIRRDHLNDEASVGTNQVLKTCIETCNKECSCFTQPIYPR